MAVTVVGMGCAGYAVPEEGRGVGGEVDGTGGLAEGLGLGCGDGLDGVEGETTTSEAGDGCAWVWITGMGLEGEGEGRGRGTRATIRVRVGIEGHWVEWGGRDKVEQGLIVVSRHGRMVSRGV